MSRGGAREGAGRPKTLMPWEEKKPRTFRLTDEEYKMVNSYVKTVRYAAKADYNRLILVLRSNYERGQAVKSYDYGQIGKVVKIKIDQDEAGKHSFLYLLEFANEERNWCEEADLQGIPKDEAPDEQP